MNTEYRYILDKGSKKYRCPGCNKKRYVRYLDRKEDEYLPMKFGRCDREHNCGYFLNPYDNGYKEDPENDWRTQPQKEQKQPDYIPYEIFSASRKGYQKNKFTQYLLKLFSESTVSDLIGRYHIGSSKHWPGSTVFWQIDRNGNIRTGKVMQYDDTGHRVKEPYNRITWVHSLIADEYELDQCLFGEHLLTDEDQPVAIVESEKTAIISSVYFPEYIWIATGAKHNLKPEKCRCFMGKQVTLFPDVGAFEEWQQKADELSYFCNISTSDLLENIAGAEEKQAGYDLADYLIQFDPKDFQARESDSQTKFDVELNDKGYPKSWDNIQLDEDEPDELQELCERDPIVKKMINMFDGEVKTASEILN
jgi:hypothetical protein